MINQRVIIPQINRLPFLNWKINYFDRAFYNLKLRKWLMGNFLMHEMVLKKE